MMKRLPLTFFLLSVLSFVGRVAFGSSDGFDGLSNSAQAISAKMTQSGSVTANEIETTTLLDRIPPLQYTMALLRQTSTEIGGQKTVISHKNPEERKLFDDNPDTVECSNHRYRFKLSRRGEEWNVKRVVVGRRSDEKLTLEPLRIPSLGSEYIQLDRISQLPHFSLLENGRNALKFSFTNASSAAQLIAPVIITMEIDPANSFLPTVYTESYKAKTYEMSIRNECSWEIEEGCVVASNFKREFTRSMNGAPAKIVRKDDWSIEYDLTSLSYEDFTLSEFGLPEPGGLDRRFPWLMTILVLVGGAMSLLGIVRQRGRN